MSTSPTTSTTKLDPAPTLAAGAAAVATGATPAPVPLTINFDDADALPDVVDALALQPFISGSQPFARSKRLGRVKVDAPLRPEGSTPARRASGAGRVAQLVEGDGWTLRSIRWRDGDALVTVSATDDDLAQSVLQLAISDATEPLVPQTDTVEIGFWTLSTGGGARRRTRRIDSPVWTDIRRNYATRAAEAVDALCALGPEQLSGRMLLLHGAPGTGKTTALRSLAHAWREWCRVELVVDPERLFADTSYLTDVLVGEEEDDEEASQWRLLVLEDCDELIRGEAKFSTGQSLSRLLNLTDGLLGQGRRVLVAITTNEDVARLHPAVVRPGRCLAQLEVGPLPFEQAVAWLGTPAGIGSGGATLAELFALRDGSGPVIAAEPTPTPGMYL